MLQHLHSQPGLPGSTTVSEHSHHQQKSMGLTNRLGLLLGCVAARLLPALLLSVLQVLQQAELC